MKKHGVNETHLHNILDFNVLGKQIFVKILGVIMKKWTKKDIF
jgi:hypothetical protein